MLFAKFENRDGNKLELYLLETDKKVGYFQINHTAPDGTVSEYRREELREAQNPHINLASFFSLAIYISGASEKVMLEEIRPRFTEACLYLANFAEVVQSLLGQPEVQKALTPEQRKLLNTAIATAKEKATTALTDTQEDQDDG